MNGFSDWKKSIKATAERSRKNRGYTKTHHRQMEMMREYKRRIESGEDPEAIKKELRARL